jgi:hypothetical protein
MGFSRRAAMIAATAVFLFAAASRADKRDDAKALFDEGEKAFDVGRFEDAATRWIAAYELVGNPTLLYNIAQAYRLANSYDKALQFYQAYLRRVEKTKVRAEVEARMIEMRKLGDLQRKSNEAPPQGTIPDDPSTHGTTTDKPPQQHVDTPQNNPTTASPQPQAVPSHAPEPQPVVEDPHTKATYRYAGYGLAALTVVSLAVAGAMSGLASSANSDVQNTAKNGGTFGPTQQSEDKNGPIYNAVGPTFYAVAGLAAVGTGVLLYLGFRQPAATQHAQIVPFLSPSSGGVAVMGRF